MAKSVGMVGTLRGKAGNFVYAKGEDGSTIVRAYQPQVTNPNTDAQILQRAKLNLAGRLSKITPKMVIIGMDGATNRQRRSRYNAIIVKSATATVNGGQGSASITDAQLKFSEGTAINWGYGTEITEGKTTATGINNVNVSRNCYVEAQGHYAEKIIAVVVDASGAMYKRITSADIEFSAATSAMARIPVGELAVGDKVNVYAVPVNMDEAVAGVDYQGLNGESGYAGPFRLINNTRGAMGDSVLLGTFTKASQN